MCAWTVRPEMALGMISQADIDALLASAGDLAEEEGHHPAILLEWGKTTVRWWTHKIGGLHQNDFVMAARTDDAYQNMQ